MSEEQTTQTLTRKVRLLKDGNANRTIFILGKTGSGKTVLAANLLLDDSRFVLFDTRNDYNSDFFGDNTTVVSNLTEFCEALNEQKPRIIFKLPSNEAQDDILEAALTCFYQFQQLNSENLPPVTILIDELNRFADSHSWPDSLVEMVQRGRDFKIEKIFGAQWFGTIPTWCRDSFSEVYTFQHTDKNGLALLERFGFDPDEVKNLPLHVCLHTGKNGIEKIRLTAVGVSDAQPDNETA